MRSLVLYLTVLVNVANSFQPSSFQTTIRRQPLRVWPTKATNVRSRQTTRPSCVSRPSKQPLPQAGTILHAKKSLTEDNDAIERSAAQVWNKALSTKSNDSRFSADVIGAVTFLTLGLFSGLFGGGSGVPAAMALEPADVAPTDAGAILGALVSQSAEQAQALWSQNTQPEVIAQRMAEADALWLKSSQLAAEASVQAKELSTATLLAIQAAMVAAEPVVKVAVSEAISFADSALITLSRLVDIVVKLVKDVYPLVDDALKSVSLRSTSSESALVFAAVATLFGLVIKSFAEQAPSAASIERLEAELAEKKKRRQRAEDAKQEAKRAVKERKEAEKQVVERAAKQQEAIAASIRAKEEAAQKARREVSLQRSTASSQGSTAQKEAASTVVVAQAAVATAAAAAAPSADEAPQKQAPAATTAPQGSAVKSETSDAAVAVGAQVASVEVTATEAVAAAQKIVEEAAAAQEAADEKAAAEKEAMAEKEENEVEKAAKAKEIDTVKAAAAEVTKAASETISSGSSPAADTTPQAAAEDFVPSPEKAVPVSTEPSKSTEASSMKSEAPRRKIQLSGSEAAVLGAVAGAAILGPVGLPVGLVVGSAGALWNAVQKVGSKDQNLEPFDEDTPPPPPPGPPPP